MDLTILKERFDTYQAGDILAMMDIIDHVDTMRQKYAASPFIETLLSGLAAYLEVRLNDDGALQSVFTSERITLVAPSTYRKQR